MNAGIHLPLFQMLKNHRDHLTERKTRQAFAWKGLRPSTSTAQGGQEQTEKDTGGSDKCVAPVALHSGSLSPLWAPGKGFWEEAARGE